MMSQEHLKEVLGFSCTCGLCMLPVEERLDSDTRIRSINTIRRLKSTPGHLTPNTTCLPLIQQLLGLYRQVPISYWRPAVTYQPAYLIVVHGDEYRGAIFCATIRRHICVGSRRRQPRHDEDDKG